MVTVDIGSEIPGEQFLPRLISIPSGGKKSFNSSARVSILHNPSATPFSPRPNKLRLRVNFLGETKPCPLLNDGHAGLQSALVSHWGGGAYAEVLEGGAVAVGDSVTWDEP